MLMLEYGIWTGMVIFQLLYNVQICLLKNKYFLTLVVPIIKHKCVMFLYGAVKALIFCHVLWDKENHMGKSDMRVNKYNNFNLIL